MILKNFPYKISVLILILSLSVSVKAQEQKWYKGNLHTHSYWSDGDEFPEMIMEWYKDHGYNFVALSDHNIVADVEKWKTIPKDSLYQTAFQEYLKEYGEDWVCYKTDSSGTQVLLKKLNEFRPRFEKAGEFMIFKAEEVTSYLNKKAVHMGAINIEHLIEPEEGETIVELLQNNLNAIKEYGEETGRTVLQHLNHPNFTYAITAEDIIQLKGERFFEVFNGHPHVNNYGDSLHPATEEMWDKINIAYLKANKPLIYGIATDDSHHYHKFGQKYSNAGRGWVTVKADTLTAEAIIQNMEKGNFYASTGVELKELETAGDKLKVSIRKEKGVSYKTQLIGVLKGKNESEILTEKKGAKVKFDLPENLLFVRAKIISDKLKKNPYRQGDYETAWIQAFVPTNK